MSHLTASSLDELDQLAARAEERMNTALEQREWSLVQSYREEMLAVDAERRQRLDAIDDHELVP